jgi:peptidoglycan hydrolase-like protein with peptidoglycan-binding domain
VTVDINVCEHSEPVREVRRIYDSVSETLGFRILRQFAGRDVLQLKVMLHALGYFRTDMPELPLDETDAEVYGPDVMNAVDRFRSDQGWQTAVAGYVDQRTIDRLWARLNEIGRADEVRAILLELARVSR